jgi:hypothetical protein
LALNDRPRFLFGMVMLMDLGRSLGDHICDERHPAAIALRLLCRSV